MRYQLMTTVKAVIDALLAGNTYEVKDEANVTMPVHIGSLPPVDKDSVNQEDVPFVLVKPGGGFKFDRPQNTQDITIQGAIYCSGDIDQGLQDLDALLQDLDQLKNKNFAPYKLIPPISGHVGDKETNINPHPYYHFEILLQFKAPVAGSTT